MIGLDTNVIVRFLVQDDPAQSRKATQLFERRLTRTNPGFVSSVVMAETAWVLERAYRQNDLEIAAAIEAMLQTDVLVIEREQEVFTATLAFKEGRASFADALIGAIATREGCLRIVTFDRKASRLAEFELL